MKLKQFTIPILLCLTILLQVGITWRYENQRIIYFLIISPFVLFNLFKKYNNKIILNKFQFFSIISAFVILLSTIIGWHLSKFQYEASRALIFQWLIFLSFLIGFIISKNKSLQNASLYTFLFTMTFSSFVGTLQYFGWIPVEDKVFPPGIIGLAGSKIDFIFLIMPSLIFLFSILNEKNKKNYIIFLLFFIIQLTAAFLSNSRTIIILLIFAFSSYTLISSTITKDKINPILISLVILIFILSPFFLWSNNFILKIYSIFNIHDVSTYSRIEYWKMAWNMFIDSNFIGAGPGYFVANQTSYLQDSFRILIPSFKYAENVHNDLFQTLCELGFLSFFAQLYIWFGILILFIKNILSEKSLNKLTLFIILISLIFHSLTNGASRHYPSGLFLWLLFGFAWGKINISKQIKINTPKFTFNTLFIIFHIFILAISIQIFLGDFYFLKSINLKNSNSQKNISYLNSSIKFCPYHPESIYKIGFFLAQNGLIEQSMSFMNKYDSIGGTLRSTNFVRSYCYLLNGEYDKSLEYANLALHKWPNYSRIYVIKAEVLSKLNLCDEKKIIENKLLDKIQNKNYPKNIKFKYIRKLLAGPYIKNHKTNKNSTSLLEFEYDQIKSIKCNNNLTTP